MHEILREEAVPQDRLRPELATPVNDVQLLGEAREEQALLERAIATADDREVAALEERAVADGAVRNTAAVVLRLPRYAELGGLAANGDDHGVGAVRGAVLELDDLTVALDADLLDRRIGLETEFERMLGHLLGELGTGDRGEAGVALDEIGVEDLAADILALEQDRAHVRPRGVESGGESGGAAADDDEVVVGQERSFLERASTD